MTEYNLGTASGRIVLDASGAERGAAQAGSAIDGLGKKSQTTSDALFNVSKSLLAVGAAGVAGFGLAINTAADFEKTMSGIKAVSGATGDEMDLMRKKALKLGADTAFSASQAAMAMEELSKSGLKVSDILGGAADATVALAAAGGIDLPTAANIAANAMNQFELSASQLPHIVDLIAGSANSSAIDVNDFGMSMAQSGAVANLIGMSFDDLALAITAMGNAGIKGSDAGTSIKAMLSNLQPVTDKQTSLFKSLGLVIDDNATSMNTTGNAFFDAQGKIKPMGEIAGVLSDALAGMSEQQKTATLEMIFGSDAIRAAGIIASTGAEGFAELADTMGRTSAADVAATRMDNFKGSIEQLKGSVDTILITVGSFFLPYLKDLADWATRVANKFGDLSPETQKLGAIIGAAAASLALLLGGMGVASHFLGPVIGSIKLLTSGIIENTIAMLASPWFWVAAAVAALVAAFIYAYTHFEGFRKVVDQVIERVSELGKQIWHYIQDVIIPALQAFAAFFMDEVLPRIVAFVSAVIAVVSTIVEWITGTFVPAVQAAWSRVADAFMAVWDWIDKNVISTVRAIIEAIIAVIRRIVDYSNDVLIPGIMAAWSVVAPIIEGALSVLGIIFQTAFDVIMGIVNFFVSAVETIWNLFGDNIWSAIKIVFEYIKGIVESVLGVIRGIFQAFTGLFTGDWGKLLDGLQTIWNSFWNLLSTVVSFFWNGLVLIVQTAFDIVHAIFKIGLDAVLLVWNTAWALVSGMVKVIWEEIRTVVEVAIAAVSAVISTVLDTIMYVWNTAWSWISSFFGGIWTTMSSAFHVVWDGITGAIGKGVAIITGFWDTLKSTTEDVWNGISSLISGIVGGITDTISGIWDGLTGAIKGAINGVIRAINSVINFINSIQIHITITTPPGFDDIHWNWDGLNLPTIPELANGAVVTKQMLAMIGEAGAEAVIPLTRPARALDLMAQSGLDQLVLSAYSPVSNLSGGGSGSYSSPSAPAQSVEPREAVHIDNANFYEQADVDMLMRSAEFAVQAGGL